MQQEGGCARRTFDHSLLTHPIIRLVVSLCRPLFFLFKLRLFRAFTRCSHPRGRLCKVCPSPAKHTTCNAPLAWTQQWIKIIQYPSVRFVVTNVLSIFLQSIQIEISVIRESSFSIIIFYRREVSVSLQIIMEMNSGFYLMKNVFLSTCLIH